MSKEKIATLVDILMKRYADHADPRRSAYGYIVAMAESYIPSASIDFHIEHNEKAYIIDQLTA